MTQLLRNVCIIGLVFSLFLPMGVAQAEEETYVFTYDLKEGQKFIDTQIMHSKSALMFGFFPVKSDVVQKNVYEYEVISVTNEEIHLKDTLKRIIIKGEMGSEVFYYDTDSMDYDPTALFLEELGQQGFSITYVFSPEGDLLRVYDLQEEEGSYAALYGYVKKFNEEKFRSNFEATTNFMSTIPRRVGETWKSIDMIISDEDKMRQESTLSFLREDNQNMLIHNKAYATSVEGKITGKMVSETVYFLNKETRFPRKIIFIAEIRGEYEDISEYTDVPIKTNFIQKAHGRLQIREIK